MERICRVFGSWMYLSGFLRDKFRRSVERGLDLGGCIKSSTMHGPVQRFTKDLQIQYETSPFLSSYRERMNVLMLSSLRRKISPLFFLPSPQSRDWHVLEVSWYFYRENCVCNSILRALWNVNNSRLEIFIFFSPPFGSLQKDEFTFCLEVTLLKRQRVNRIIREIIM